jgi:hypothetical protein
MVDDPTLSYLSGGASEKQTKICVPFGKDSMSGDVTASAEGRECLIMFEQMANDIREMDVNISQMEEFKQLVYQKDSAFDREEIAAVEAELTKMMDAREVAARCMEEKITLYETKVVDLERIIGDRVSVLDNSTYATAILEKSPPLMELFSSKHALLLSNLKDARDQLGLPFSAEEEPYSDS